MANTTATCPPKTMPDTSNGVWQGDVPIHYALPLLIIQITLVLAITRALAFLLKPLRQPRVIAEIIVSSQSSIDVVVISAFLPFSTFFSVQVCINVSLRV